MLSFWGKRFHQNDSANKIADYCALVGVHFEYTNYWNKDDFLRNARNMTSLSRRFKNKIKTMGGKGGNSSATEKKKQEEEATKKRAEEAHRLSREAKQRLAEEAQQKRKEEEQQKRQQEEYQKR